MRAHIGLDEPALERDRDRLRSSVDAELREDVLDVRRYRLRADHQLRRDLSLRASVCEEPEDLALARAEASILAPASLPFPFPFEWGAVRRSDRLTRAMSSPASSGFET